ncbi:MAG: hypothetical protein WAM30_18085 [Candidatus Dormiibacterota bacterium]
MPIPQRLAALDIGSNTVHALVADVVDGHLREVGHYVEMPELGARVDRTGRIGPAGTAVVLEALESVLAQARGPGFEHVVAGATAAVREAPDGQEFLDMASLVAGTPVRLISAEREAQLSFLGVASAHRVPGEWVMADIGGASTELVAAHGEQIAAWASQPVGSGALAARYLSDPPLPGERMAVRAAAAEALAGAPPSRCELLVVTGGTASNLPLVLSDVEPPSVIGPEQLARADQILDQAPAADLAAEGEVPESRLRALRGGTEILRLLLARYQVPSFEVSYEGLRHGMALAYARLGDRWPEVESLAIA